MCIDFLAYCCLSSGERKKKNMRCSIHFCLLNARVSSPRRCANYHNTSMKDGVSRSQSPCLSVASLFVCLSLSSAPCCRQTRQAVPNKRAQGGLLWQQLLWSAALSVLLSLPLCVRVCVSCPCRADGPSSHGAGSSCVLCCRSGSLSHRSVVSTVSCHKQPQLQPRSGVLFIFGRLVFGFLNSLSVSSHRMCLPICLTHPPYPFAVSLICFSSCAFLRAILFSHCPSLSVHIRHPPSL